MRKPRKTLSFNLYELELICQVLEEDDRVNSLLFDKFYTALEQVKDNTEHYIRERR